MSYTDKKITQEEINAHHVQGATDHLIGNAQQNKAVFDDLPEFIAGKHNELIDELNSHHGDEIKVAVDEWLAEHPEVTTTVQDNSLTTAKYVDGSVTEPKIAEGAVTPSKLDRAYSTPADLASVNANLTNELNVLDARMDEFASLPEGSTSGNAELVDIRVGVNGETYPTAGGAVRGQVGDLKSDLNKLMVTTEATSGWTFSTTTNAGVQNTIRFSASVCEISGRLKSVSIKMRNEDSGSISLCLAEVVGTTATVYAVIPITLHSNPATNIEYVNGADFTYSNDVRANTIFGVWSDTSKQINFGTETVKSYYLATESPANSTFTLSDHTATYNVAVSFDVVKAEPAVTAEEVDEIKGELSSLVTEETIQSTWSFSTSTNSGIVNTIRFSASLCAKESKLESVSIKTRNEDSGSVSICLAEVNGTTATVYAVIPITLHTNPATNIEYVNGVDFNYSDKVRANTVFGVWADHSVQVNYGTETVRSYYFATETPANSTFTLSDHTATYNVAVAFKTTVKVPIANAVKKIVVFGDSWTDIVNTTWTRWPVLINSLDEYDVTSYGVTGSTISGHVANQVNSFLGASATADVFIMMGGINDYRGGIANTSIISAIQGYYSQLKEAYPNARFIYLANNQLYYTAHQLKYFNTIVEQLNINGIEAYSMFAWASPSQYADDFLHLGNAGNICLANNILKLLRGGEIKTVVNRLHWDIMNDQNARIGQMNIYEFYENGYPRIEIKGVASGALANMTVIKTINTKTFFTSAPWAVFPYATDNINNRVRIYSPQSESLDSNNQVTSFDLTFITTNTGFVFTTSANGLVYEN